MITRIKELRAKYNLTQEDLAKKVNVRRETIVFLEKKDLRKKLEKTKELIRLLLMQDT